MLETIWEIFQTAQIIDSKAEAKNAASLSITSSVAAGEFRGQLDTLVLANQAMWEILSEKLGVTDKELVKKMNEIDLRDGKLDGKGDSSSLTSTECPDCGKKIGKRRTNCYWCGARVVGVSPFSG